ncbi:death-associated inhibitor of apoptosis 2 [Nomia melanderi]|uniref:death-associated inhibitor of apoptosis 2 n=1 Tax=Nomia melanderi TaxID=2448451 RepID=UPI003FCD7F60
MNIEKNRLQTFSDWPANAPIDATQLAKAGFYYTGHEDVVICAYCKGVLKKWERGDDPNVAHRIHFPQCDFYLHQNADDVTASLTELGIQTHAGPKQPDHATYEGRLSTFSGWPEKLKQTPEILASAGFYYTGLGDQVRCFHCDGGLRDWEVTDDVWTEHARWFPKCEFVNLIRGQKFIQQCIANRPPLNPSIFEGVPEDESADLNVTSTVSLCAASSSTQGITKTEEAETLNWVPVSTLMQRNDNAEGCNDSEITSSQQDLTEDKSKVISDKTENLKTPDKHDNSFQKAIDVKLEENASLEEENRRLKEARLCKICMDQEVAIVFLPCGHLATCVFCAASLTYCQICRQEILANVRAFLS